MLLIMNIDESYDWRELCQREIRLPIEEATEDYRFEAIKPAAALSKIFQTFSLVIHWMTLDSLARKFAISQSRFVARNFSGSWKNP